MFKLLKELFDLNRNLSKKKKEFESITEEQKKIFEEQQKHFENLILERQKELSNINGEISKKDEYVQELKDLKEEIENQKQRSSKIKDLLKIKELYNAMENSINKYFEDEKMRNVFFINKDESMLLEQIEPTVNVNLKLHCMDCKKLRKAYNDNFKLIDTVLNRYKQRYTTKTNAAIYKLMVIALKAELQNILYNLKYENLDKSISDVKEMTEKYLSIAFDGNQVIANTLVKFIGEIEYLFINAVNIEYEYYLKRQQEKEEQIALREQIKQEAEDRILLEEQRRQIEREEGKYKTEITKLQELLNQNYSEKKVEELEKRIQELENQLLRVEEKKDEIFSLQNGKAGYVYVISNLGAFGENIFKIGMTRRLDPQERINELGNASVPFSFDVHSFIFSDDAVGLEQRIHYMLNNKRVNKVNMRKEFFKISIEEIERLVHQIDPSAEFTKTMLAEQYRQSLKVN